MGLHEPGVGEDRLVRLEEHRVRGALEPPHLLGCLPLEQLEHPLLVAVRGLHVTVREPVGVRRDLRGHQERLGGELEGHEVVVLHRAGRRLRQHRAQPGRGVVAAHVHPHPGRHRPAPRRPRPTSRAAGTVSSPPRCAGCGTWGPRRAGGRARWSRYAGNPPRATRSAPPARRSPDGARYQSSTWRRFTRGVTSDA